MLFKDYKISKEMKQDILNFVLYPENTMNSINKAESNFQIMNVLSMLYGKSSITDKETIWNKFEGFSNIEETKEFVKGIIDISDKEKDSEISNLLFLYGCMLIHRDNMDNGRYLFKKSCF